MEEEEEVPSSRYEKKSCRAYCKSRIHNALNDAAGNLNKSG